MSEHDPLIKTDILAYLQTHENKTMLRFITCGNVDDGKSTLIGRLLYDSKLIYEDQLADISNANAEAPEGDIDFAALVDGLAAEREQGITIDVAYRYFSTQKRKFIVGDTPGHEQYTRNMATGASTAELAIILIDAQKGVRTQTKRHSYIVSLLGIKHVIIAINKMDLIDYSLHKFNAIEEEFRLFSQNLGFEDIQCIPISALSGANITAPSQQMDWYRGPCLLSHLENVDTTSAHTQDTDNFRLPIQWVNRPNQNFRGYAGTIVSGKIQPGDEIIVIPSGKRSIVKKIVTMDGNLDKAVTGQAITLTLTDEIDISSGDIICGAEHPAEQSDQFQAHILWMAEQKLYPGRSYLLRTVNKTVAVSITKLKHRVNINNFSRQAAKTLGLNDVGLCTISLDKTIAFDPYNKCRRTGNFIIIDRHSNETVGMGMIDFSLRRASNLVWQDLKIGKQERAVQKHQKPAVLWFTGLSGSGKSTIANLVEQKLYDIGRHTYILDGDNVRHGLNKDLGFTDADRVENIRRIGETARLMADAGLIVLVSFISPFRAERNLARTLMESDEFIEIYVNTPLEVVEARDTKGLYARARRGEIKNFTGIDSEYQAPQNPEIEINTATLSAQEAANKIIDYLKAKGLLESLQ